MAQFARPASDVETGLWTSTPLWSKVNEGDPGDDVTIASADNSNGDNAEFTTTNVTDPQVDTGHVLRVQWAKSASGGHTINGNLELWQGTVAAGTLIATLTVNDLSEVFQTDTLALTTGQAGNITDYTDLNLQLLRTGTVGGQPATRRSLVVDFAELEVPDLPASLVHNSQTRALRPNLVR